MLYSIRTPGHLEIVSSGIFSYSFCVGFALPRLMMFGVAASVLLSPLCSGGVLSGAYRTNLFVLPPLCTSAHFQHSQLQSIIRRYNIPASLISIQHWCFFWTFFAGMLRDTVGSDNIWQIDEVNVSFPNVSLLSVFIENITLFSLLICPFIICISFPKRDKGHTQLEWRQFSARAQATEVATQQMRSFYFEAFSTIVIILKKDRNTDV